MSRVGSAAFKLPFRQLAYEISVAILDCLSHLFSGAVDFFPDDDHGRHPLWQWLVGKRS